MLKAYKYRIYPTPEQVAEIDQTIGVCRLFYNLALEVKISAFKAKDLRISAYTLKKEYEWIGRVNSQAIVQSINSVDAALKNFFIGRGGIPEF